MFGVYRVVQWQDNKLVFDPRFIFTALTNLIAFLCANPHDHLNLCTWLYSGEILLYTVMNIICNHAGHVRVNRYVSLVFDYIE